MILPCIAIVFLLSVTIYSAIASFRKQSDDIPHTWIFPDRASRFVRVVVGVCTLVLIAMLIGLAMWSHAGNGKAASQPSRFLVPEGYVGWVRIEFDVSGTPEIPVEDGAYIFKVPPTGVLKTSSKIQYGGRWDRYYYYSEGGRKRELPDADQGGKSLIWDKISGAVSGSSGEKTYEEFFVGTEQQFREQVKAAPTTAPGTPEK